MGVGEKGLHSQEQGERKNRSIFYNNEPAIQLEMYKKTSFKSQTQPDGLVTESSI